MKKLLLIKSVLLLTSLALAENVARLDYSNGFCVPDQSELLKENAVVIVNQSEMNGRFIANVDSLHYFFAPESPVEELVANDFAGSLSLKKKFKSYGVTLATYENRHDGSSIDTIPVKCVVDIPAEKKSFKVSGSAKANPWSGDLYCDLHAIAQADKSAESICAAKSAHRIFAVAKESKNFMICSIEATYICE